MTTKIEIRQIAKSEIGPRGYPVADLRTDETTWAYATIDIDGREYSMGMPLFEGRRNIAYIPDEKLKGSHAVKLTVETPGTRSECAYTVNFEMDDVKAQPTVDIEVGFGKKVPRRRKKEKIASVSIKSSDDAEATLTLFKDEREIVSEPVSLKGGKTVSKGIRAPTLNMVSGRYTVQLTLADRARPLKKSGIITFSVPEGSEGLEFRCEFPDAAVYPHPVTDLGRIVCTNNTGKAASLFVTVSVDGEEVVKNIPWTADSESIFPIRANVLTDTDMSHIVQVFIRDRDGRCYFADESCIQVMSKYAFDLENKNESTNGFMTHYAVYRKLHGDIRKGGPMSLKGYSDGGTHILPVLEQIYRGLHTCGFTYSRLPTEGRYQYVQNSCMTMKRRRGSCIDLSIMIADILKMASLRPVIIFLDGHAVTGIELTSEVKEKNLGGVSVMKLEGRRIIPLESTCLCSTGDVYAAIKAGEKSIKDSKTCNVMFVCDYPDKPYAFGEEAMVDSKSD
ncbi:MAG: hypothetical protein II855_04540 [Candidatus Methanomethylophilaceae archaeon]|nr:hypothetical protein [Candidatus Methanomethylophilaceae archaeon]